MTANLPRSAICRSCHEELQASDNFCRRCGTRSTQSAPRRWRAWLAASIGITTLVSGVCVFGTSAIQRAHGTRVKPAAVVKSGTGHSPHSSGEMPELSAPTLALNSNLKGLLSQARSTPKDPAAWTAVGVALLDLLSTGPSSGEIQLEALDVFSYLLSIAPDDVIALRALGDLCFDQRLFPKSLNYYDRYLKLQPNDQEVRSRRASTLTFLGRAQEAITELQEIAKAQPEAFQPLAYLSIAFSQNGDIEQARVVGEQALTKAPSPEAKERFQSFLTSLTAPAPQGTPGTMQPTSSQQTSLSSTPWITSLEEHVRNNPIAGRKFVSARFAEDSKTVFLSFADFPMEGMPEFARVKFLSSLKAVIPPDTASTITCIDQASNRVMHTEPMTPTSK